MKSGTFPVDGADLYYEVRGSGPALFIISGAGGDAGFFAAAADELTDAFTVITYDRRGNSRSTGRKAEPMTFAQQASDARSLIDGLAGGRAIVFGNSAGGDIALALAAQHPDVIIGLIVHEPPTVSVLPERTALESFLDSIETIFATDGGEVALTKFASTVRGEGSYEWPHDLTERVGGNVEHIFASEWTAITRFTPDLAALKRAPFPIAMTSGSASRGEYYARPSAVIAREIGALWTEFPGLHLESLARPAVFAGALRAVATLLFVKATGTIPEQWARTEAPSQP